MWRMIGVLVALGVIGWLAMTQLDGAGGGAAAEAARAAGVDDVVELDEDAAPGEVAGQVGRQVESMVGAGKARIDAAVDDAR